MAEELAEEEEFLDESSIEKLRLILEGFPFCTALVDEDHKVIYANRRMRAVLGTEFGNQFLRHAGTQEGSGNGHTTCPVCGSTKRGYSAVSLELRSGEGDATLNIAMFPLSVRTRKGGRLFLCIGWDTSEKHAGYGLNHSTETDDGRYKAIFQNTPNMVGILTDRGVVVDANPVMLECFGHDVVGRSISEVTPEDVSGRLLHHISCAVNECRRVTFEFGCKDRHYLMSAVPVDLAGKKHCLLIGRDVTELKSREVLLEALISVEKLIDTEKDRRALLEKVCRVLASLPGYVLARIDLAGEFRLSALAGKVSDAEGDALCRMMEHVMTSESPAFTTVRECTGNCKVKRHLGDSDVWISSFPLKAEKVAGTLTVYHSRVLS